MAGATSRALGRAAAVALCVCLLAAPAAAEAWAGDPPLSMQLRDALDAFGEGRADQRTLAVLFRDQAEIARALEMGRIRAPLYRRVRSELTEISGRLATEAAAAEDAALVSRMMASVGGSQPGVASDGVIVVQSRAQAQAVRARYDMLAERYLIEAGAAAEAGDAWSAWMVFPFMADPRSANVAEFLAIEDLNEPCYRRDALGELDMLAQTGRMIGAAEAMAGTLDADRMAERKRAKIAALLDNPDLLGQPSRMVDFYETMAEEPRRIARIAAAAEHLRRRFHLPPQGWPVGAEVARLWVREDAALSELAAGHPFRRAAEADAVMALAATYAELEGREAAPNAADQVATLLDRLSEADRAMLLERVAAIASPAFAAEAAGRAREQSHALRALENAERDMRGAAPNRRDGYSERAAKSNTARPSLKRGAAQFNGGPPR